MSEHTRVWLLHCKMFTGVQEKLGILSGGAVYAVFDYTAQQQDELSFTAGQQITVLRKGDENEREWWWARLNDNEGYIPRNLLGVSIHKIYTCIYTHKHSIHLIYTQKQTIHLNLCTQCPPL